MPHPARGGQLGQHVGSGHGREHGRQGRRAWSAISNSYGGSESSSELSTDSAYNHPGLAITVSSGDSGYGVEYPAASQYVTAVGGTTLTQASNSRGWTETAWSGAGSGCSAYEPKPSWQHDTGLRQADRRRCLGRRRSELGLGVYDTYNSCGSSSFCDYLIELGAVQGLDGWAQVGGTSLSSPLIASVYTLAGNTASVTYGSYPYCHASSLFDVTSGSNGTCSPSYLCTAGRAMTARPVWARRTAPARSSTGDPEAAVRGPSRRWRAAARGRPPACP